MIPANDGKRPNFGVFVANTIALVSLVSTIGIFFYTQDKLAETGPYPQVSSAVVSEYDGRRPAPEPEPGSQEPVITRRDKGKFDNIWIEISIANVGGSPTVITNVQLPVSAKLSLGPQTDASSWCYINNKHLGDRFCPSPLRQKLDPGSRLEVYFIIDSYWDEISYTNKPLQVKIWATGVDDYQPRVWASGISIEK